MALLRDEGFSEAMIRRFFAPFFGGVCLDPEIRASSRVLAYVLRMFATQGLFLQPTDRPWRRIVGGGRTYIERLCRPFRERIFAAFSRPHLQASCGGPGVPAYGLFDALVGLG